MKSQGAIRVGAGAGTSDDRMVPALELAERGDIDYLVFECLAERTVSRENLSRSKNPDQGYSPSLHARLRLVLPTCIGKGIRIVSNMGAANPLGGARAARKEAADLGLGDVAVAVVLGDDVSSLVQHKGELRLIENGEPLESILPKMISANAYLGADVVCEALKTGAPIVLSGRVADPSLFLAPMMHEFGWACDDLPRIAQGTAAGHLLECTASVTGGCFGWPGKPLRARSGTSFFPGQPKQPPVTDAVHSSRWPAAVPCAILGRSSYAQPNSCIIGARKSDGSATRPDSTIGAPVLSASQTTSAPR